MISDTHNGFRMGGWQVYPLRNLLVGPPGEIHIEPKVMQVLESLASNAGEVVERETLLNDIWDGRSFADESLTRCIATLRHVLGDDPKDPTYIQTIPKSGYRLVCPVESMEQTADSAKDDSGNRGGRRVALPVVLSVIVIAALYMTYQVTSSYKIESPQLTVEGTTLSEPPVNSIAVLPFRNRSAESEDAFFVDGIHDDIVMRLARLSSLERVISRTSVERYRETDKSVSQIGQELGVAIVLEGGVQRAGDRVRINVQLIDAATDEHLWVESYDRQLTIENLFAIQSEISREIVGVLQLMLTDEEEERLQIMPTISLEAYGEYVLGRHEMTKFTSKAYYRAQAHFEKAIELDPNYALAHTGLADALGDNAYFRSQAEDNYASRKAAIDRALALDPLSGEAYTSLGFLAFHEEKAEAEKHILKAIELSPNYALAYYRYYYFLYREGLPEERLVAIRKAVELDPMDPRFTARLGNELGVQGRLAESQAVLLKGLERNPEFPLYYYYMSIDLVWQGRIGEAMQWIRAATRLDPASHEYKHFMCRLYLHLGDDLSAERCIDSWEQDFPIATFSRRWLLYDFRHQFQKSVNVLEQIVQQQDPRNRAEVRSRLAWRYLNSGDVDKARSIWKELVPELYGDEDVVVKPYRSEVSKTAMVAYTLYVDGDLDRANYLFDQALDAIRSMSHTREWGYSPWDVFIHVTRGEKQKAISALREDMNLGWRWFWYQLKYPPYDLMREEPEWIELLTELEADIARQRQWYEDHKDDPLF